MEGEPRGATRVRFGRTADLPIIHLVPTNRVAPLRQVNAYLVRAARLQPACNQGEPRQLLDRFNVGDGLLALPGLGDAPAPAVTAVAHQARADRLRLKPSRHNSEVTA